MAVIVLFILLFRCCVSLHFFRSMDSCVVAGYCMHAFMCVFFVIIIGGRSLVDWFSTWPCLSGSVSDYVQHTVCRVQY